MHIFYAHILNNLYLASNAEKHPLERGETIDMGQVFWTYVNCKNGSVKILMEIAKRYESHRGIQIALDAYLETILALQPDRMYLRALVPLLMLQLGKAGTSSTLIHGLSLISQGLSWDFQLMGSKPFLKI